jgi:hypothetical protein
MLHVGPMLLLVQYILVHLVHFVALFFSLSWFL